MELVIEKGIPAPQKQTLRWAILKQMVVGDSVMLPDVLTPQKIQDVLKYYTQSYGYCFVYRQERDKETRSVTGYRVWRVAEEQEPRLVIEKGVPLPVNRRPMQRRRPANDSAPSKAAA